LNILHSTTTIIVSTPATANAITVTGDGEG